MIIELFKFGFYFYYHVESLPPDTLYRRQNRPCIDEDKILLFTSLQNTLYIGIWYLKRILSMSDVKHNIIINECRMIQIKILLKLIFKHVITTVIKKKNNKN